MTPIRTPVKKPVRTPVKKPVRTPVKKPVRTPVRTPVSVPQDAAAPATGAGGPGGPRRRQAPSRVLFAPETFNLAEVTRAIEVARRMPAGVECVFAGFSPRNTEYIKAAGFETRLLEPRLTDKEALQALALDQGRSLRHPFTRTMLAHRVTSERALIRQLRPAATVIGVTPSQFISSRAELVPLVFLRPFAYSTAHVEAARSCGSTGWLPRTTPWQRAVDHVASRAFSAAAYRLPLPRAFHQVAARNGVVLPDGVVPSLTADINLVATAPALLPSWVQMPPGHQVVGPVYAQLPGEVPELVRQLAARPEPLVYFAVGSSGNRDLVLEVLRGLGRARCQVLAPVLSHLRPEDLHRLPRNVHVTDWLPAHRLGSAIDMAITHGGEGTVQTSCTQGWPFIGIPLQLEQRFTLQRCSALGCARLVPRGQVARTDWARLVHEVLEDTTMRSRARAMARHMAGLDGPGQAAAAVSALL